MSSCPFILLDSARCRQNIARMEEKARTNGLVFRPHFKTHQSHAVGRWFREVGVNRITVSSAEMAGYFAKDGWNDITIAFPLSRFHVEAVNRLAENIQLNITFSSIRNLLDALPLISQNVGVLIEVDVGHHRTGVNISDTRQIALMVNQVAENPKLAFRGFIAHAGQSYSVTGEKNVLAIHNQAMGELVKLKSFWSQQYPEIVISYGDTPTCSLADDFWGVNEIRPGNFVFYDIMQHLIGSCSLDDIALALICPVVDVYPEREEAVVHCGAVHLSKDFVLFPESNRCYGLVCPYNGIRWGAPVEGAYVTSLSQEHGIISFGASGQPFPFHVGDLVAILPVHSCLTLDTMGEMVTESGEKISTMRSRAAWGIR